MFFFRDNFQFARDIFWKSARDKKPQILPVNIDKLPVTNSYKNAREKRKMAVAISAILPVT